RRCRLRRIHPDSNPTGARSPCGYRWSRETRGRTMVNGMNGRNPNNDLPAASSDQPTVSWSRSLPVDAAIARILDRALDGEEIGVDQAVTLFDAKGPSLTAVMMAADEMRRRTVGDVVTYVINRNINFTNVCIKHCGFCAFSRDHREEEGYFLPIEEVVRRAREAWDLGATEVCIQAGLPPKLDGRVYIDLTRALKAALPDLRLHTFSPEEVLYGA